MKEASKLTLFFKRATTITTGTVMATGTFGLFQSLEEDSKKDAAVFNAMPKEKQQKLLFLRDRFKNWDYDGQPLLRASLSERFDSGEFNKEFRQWKWKQAQIERSRVRAKH